MNLIIFLKFETPKFSILFQKNEENAVEFFSKIYYFNNIPDLLEEIKESEKKIKEIKPKNFFKYFLSCFFYNFFISFSGYFIILFFSSIIIKNNQISGILYMILQILLESLIIRLNSKKKFNFLFLGNCIIFVGTIISSIGFFSNSNSTVEISFYFIIIGYSFAHSILFEFNFNFYSKFGVEISQKIKFSLICLLNLIFSLTLFDNVLMGIFFIIFSLFSFAGIIFERIYPINSLNTEINEKNIIKISLYDTLNHNKKSKTGVVNVENRV